MIIFLGNVFLLQIENKCFRVFDPLLTAIPVLACESSAYLAFCCLDDDQSRPLGKHSLLEGFNSPAISLTVVDIIDFEIS
jgi:hypothetical protein